MLHWDVQSQQVGGGGATKEHAVTRQLTHCAAVGHHTHHIPEHSNILSADFDVRQAVKD